MNLSSPFLSASAKCARVFNCSRWDHDLLSATTSLEQASEVNKVMEAVWHAARALGIGDNGHHQEPIPVGLDLTCPKSDAGPSNRMRSCSL